MRVRSYSLVSLLLTLVAIVQGQQGCSDAAGCVSNVDGTDCNATDFGCLCKSSTYIDNYNNCVYTNCPQKYDQDVSFLAMVQICGIFHVAVTASPEASLSSVASAGAASNFPTNISSISAISNPLQGPPHHSTLSVPITGSGSFTSGGSFTPGSSFPSATPTATAGSTSGAPSSIGASSPTATATSAAGGGSSASPSASGSNLGVSLTVQWSVLGGLLTVVVALLCV